MKLENNDEQLITKLKKLPKVKDHRDKDELFQRISAQMNKKEPRKHYRLAPIFSTIVALILIFTIVPTLINLDMSDTSSNDSAKNFTQESSHEMDMIAEESDEEQEAQVFDNQIESYVIQNINNDSTVIYGAVSDDQIQTVIPFTIVIPETVDLNEQYNQLGQYLNENDWGVNEYLFNDVNFDLDLVNHEVRMQVPSDFSIGDGSSNAYIFNEVLTAMFTPYQIDKVVFEEEIDLGSIGNISELDLQKSEKEMYKVFQANQEQRKFLVPIHVEEDVTIEEALEDMRSGQESFHIYPAISEDVHFSITTSDQELILNLDKDLVFEDEQEATVMIEAILMTAKSFGYESVTFNNTSIDQVGPYQLSKSIEVPEAINPIYNTTF